MQGHFVDGHLSNPIYPSFAYINASKFNLKLLNCTSKRTFYFDKIWNAEAKSGKVF